MSDIFVTLLRKLKKIEKSNPFHIGDSNTNRIKNGTIKKPGQTKKVNFYV